MDYLIRGVGASIFSAIGMWLARLQLNLHWPYVVMIGLGLFGITLFIWDVLVRHKPIVELQSVTQTPDTELPVTVTPTPPFATVPVGRLAFVHKTHARIGPGMGTSAFMIAFRNTEMDFRYLCRNIKANLRFTNLFTKETFTERGWFVTFEGDKARKPVPLVSLSSNEHAWIVLHLINDIGGELYPFAGPGGALDSISDWTINVIERGRLDLGKWQIKVNITSDSGDELEETVDIQAT
ncbi:MAG: hypothetical protein ABSC23_21745 [Bryobacteraceae bacterium]